MDDKLINKISNDLDIIKKLLALMLKQQDIKGDAISKAMGITEGRLSQLISNKKNKKSKSRNK